MDATSRYWCLVRLDSQGRCRFDEQPTAKAWFETHIQPFDSTIELSDRVIQAQLVQHWREDDEHTDLALLCLRCFISHQIQATCQKIANRFGGKYRFVAEDLLPRVLTDDGKPIGEYQHLAIEILQSFDPAQANLSTWASRLTQQSSELNQVLLTEYGLYQVSDWAILNDTTAEQVERILRDFHHQSGYEIEQAQTLLRSYHQVYRQARFQQRLAGDRSRCSMPTNDQLHQMNPEQPPRRVLAQLRQLADLLRAYRIYARSGLRNTDSIDDPDLPEQAAAAPSDEELAQQQFHDQYQQQFLVCLDAAIAHVLNQRRTKHPNYLKALQAFQCEGCSMTAIAPMLDRKTQTQVTRLLNLKQLRADIRHAWIQRLLLQIRELAANYATPDQLCSLDQWLEELLQEQIDGVMDEADRETRTAKNRTANSLFARRVCYQLHQLDY